jgi:glycolate oxidase FAD binding subunit
MQNAATIEEVQRFVRDNARVHVAAGATKPALSRGANLCVKNLAGMLEYQPGEFTFTALAGTPIREVQQQLHEHGQYLPFDPPLAEAGATLGGTVAAGLSGPGRFRYGGVRDFLLGVRLVNGAGDVVFGGGKVVKNAAGFDIPKLMIGSLGQFGVIVEVTFKVFPARQASTTLTVELADVAEAVRVMNRLAMSNADIDHLDFEPPGKLWIRLSGMRDAIAGRVERLKASLPNSADVQPVEDDAAAWRDAREFAWAPAGQGLVKIPITPDQIAVAEASLAQSATPLNRRYSVGGNVLWLAWPAALPESELTGLLKRIQRPALAIRGEFSRPLFAEAAAAPFHDRLKQVFDPHNRFTVARGE